MVHNASGMAWGDKTDMRETADLLQKIELSIVADYTTKTGKSDDEIVALMDAETWMTADEALANGFIDTVITAKAKTKNTWNLGAYKNAPAAEPAEPAGFFMSDANANKLALLIL